MIARHGFISMIIEVKLTVTILFVGLWLGIVLLVRGNFRRVLGRVGRCLSMGDAPCFGFLQNFSLHFAVANFYLR